MCIRLMVALTVTLCWVDVAFGDAAADIAASRDSAIVRAIKRSSPAVVNIHSTQTQRVYNPFWELWGFSGFQDFFGPRVQERQYQSLGSGCVFDAQNGYVLTNQHVIEDADQIHVGLQDGRVFEAKVVGADAFSDLAVLKIDGSGLPEAKLGVSADLRIGEWAIAIGNPFGLLVRDRKPTVTVGVVSAVDRVVTVGGRTYSTLVQTDASVNPGNSGGPLVNAAGEVIGINTFIFTESGGSHGVNFAIAVDTAKKVVGDLIRVGHVTEAWFGLIYSQVANRNTPGLQGAPDGVVVTYVEQASPAALAGVRSGDVIVSVDGQQVYGVEDTRAATRLLHPGDRVQMELMRGTRSRQVTVTAAAPSGTFSFFGADVGRGARGGGVVVERVSQGSVFDHVLQAGDKIIGIGPPQITTVNQLEVKVNSVEDLREGALRIPPGVKVALVFERGGRMYPYVFMVS